MSDNISTEVQYGKMKMDLDSSYNKLYKIRRIVEKEYYSVAIPPVLMDAAANKLGLSVDQFTQQYNARVFFKELDGMYVKFEKTKTDDVKLIDDKEDKENKENKEKEKIDDKE